jgi:hypothetical protein
MSKRHVVSIAALTAATLFLAGCGTDDNNTATPAPGATGTASAPVINPTAPGDVLTSRLKNGLPTTIQEQINEGFKNQKPFTGPQATKFGADNVMAAYKTAIEWSVDNSFDPSLAQCEPNTDCKLTPGKFTKFTLDERVTPHFVETVERLARDAETNSKSAGALNEMVFLGPLGVRKQFVQGGPTVAFADPDLPSLSTVGFGPATTYDYKAKNGVDGVIMEFEVLPTYAVTVDGAGGSWPLKKTMSVWLVPGPEKGTWQVDDWNANGFDYTLPPVVTP